MVVCGNGIRIHRPFWNVVGVFNDTGPYVVRIGSVIAKHFYNNSCQSNYNSNIVYYYSNGEPIALNEWFYPILYGIALV